ncbi:MAG: BLUF domain-containing protein [Pseudomonadota bacterium]
MRQLIYHSRPFGFDQATLLGILSQARRNNRKWGITGALVCRRDLYVQLIEGPEDAIDKLFSRIAEDDRHCDVALLHRGHVSARIFSKWEMLDDSAPSMTWSADEIESGSVENATREELVRLFEKIALKAAN